MLKYVNYAITFAEIPEEISLCFSLSNCDGLCEGCHSAELREDRGEPLKENILNIIDQHNYGISCVCFLGEGGKSPNAKEELLEIIEMIRTKYPLLKIALYSGRAITIKEFVEVVDYYKIGPYIAKFGPLNSRTTNQILYKIRQTEKGRLLENITSKFWRKNED